MEATGTSRGLHRMKAGTGPALSFRVRREAEMGGNPAAHALQEERTGSRERAVSACALCGGGG